MPSLSKQTMKITIIDDSSLKKCNGDCGVDWSSAEATSLARQRIAERFGDKIKLVFHDLTQTTADAEALEWKETIKDKDLSVPLLLVNGKIRISGLFDIRQLMDTIEIEMEISA